MAPVVSDLALLGRSPGRLNGERLPEEEHPREPRRADGRE